MKSVRSRLVFLLLLVLLPTLLSGCDADPIPAVPTGTAAVTTEAPVVTTAEPPLQVTATAITLELDGSEIGPICNIDSIEYVKVRDLTAHWSLSTSEPEAGILRLNWPEGAATLRNRGLEADLEDGETRILSYPVLHGEGEWFLPLVSLQELWGRVGYYDAELQTLRCFLEEPGPELRYNGEVSAESLLRGGAPVLTAEAFCAMTGAESERNRDERGLAILTLRVFGQELLLREGSPRAELEGALLELSVPVSLDAGNWYLPAEILEDLSCVSIKDPETGVVDYWRVTEGPELWLDGTGMGKALLCGETPCVPLPATAAALDGILPQSSHAWLLTVGDHTLSFFPGSKEAEADGEAVILPAPAILWREEPLIPVEFLSEALGIPRLEGEELIFSRMEARDTLIWVDGKEAASFVRGESPLYLRLNDVCLPEENPPELWTNSAEFTVCGKRLLLTGGSKTVQIDDRESILSAPVLADGETWYVPTELLTAVGLTEFEDPDLDQIYYTHIVRHEDLAAGYRVPVLMYHAVSDDIWGIPELFISPSTLEKQLQAMLEGGYTAITFEDLDHIDEIEKPVMLTFDDGYDDNYEYLFPLLQKYNVKATVFVIVNDLGKNHKLTGTQVKEMSDSGLVSIQSHTMSHNYLDEMSESQLIKEHYNSMLELARITGKQPFVMCYPTGKSAGYTRKITAQYYEYGLCMGGPCWVTGDAPYLIYRYYIPRKTSLDTFLRYLEG